MANACDNCLYSTAAGGSENDGYPGKGGKHSLICRRYPPRICRGGDDRPYPFWPWVQPGQICGEWKKRAVEEKGA